jgi:hypothetical protein
MTNLEKSAEHEHRSRYDQDINIRLKKYAEENNEDYSEMKAHFRYCADPYNMKTPYEAGNIYYQILDELLTDEGY